MNIDEIVDLSDATIIDNNAFNFVGAAIPPGYSPTSFKKSNDLNLKNPFFEISQTLEKHFNH